MNATLPITISYRSSTGEHQQLEIPSRSLVILTPGDENRRLFRALVDEAERRRELDTPSYSLITPSNVITSPLPPATIIRLHAFSRSSQLLYELLSLSESLCAIARENGATCPTCGVTAESVPLEALFSSLNELFKDKSIALTVPSSELPHQIRARFSEIIRDGVVLDTLDLSDEQLATGEPVIGVVYRGRITPEREATIQDAVSILEEDPDATIQIRPTEPPFPVYRYLGSRPTCPQCGRSTYPISPLSLHTAVEELTKKEQNSSLLWYPALQSLLLGTPADTVAHPADFPSTIGELLELLRDFGITAPLATPISEISLRERLGLRFLPARAVTGGILLIELPSYGLFPNQANALKRWLTHQKDHCAGIVALGGEDLIRNAADIVLADVSESPAQITIEQRSPGEIERALAVEGSSSVDTAGLLAMIQSQPPQVFGIKPLQAKLIAEALLQSGLIDSLWTIIDLVSIILDRNASSRPLLTTLPIFRRLTALYAQVTAARVMGITPRALSLSGPNSERCEECDGLGKTIEASHAITCIRCSGTRFRPRIAQLTFRGLPFPALFNHTAKALTPLFSSLIPIAQELALLNQMGLGQIVLGTAESELPSDVRLRAALLTACAKSPKGRVLLIRGLSGILSPQELLATVSCLNSFASTRALHLIHDGAREIEIKNPG